MKNKNIILTLVFVLFLSVMSVCCWFKPHTAYSESERRPTAEKPQFSAVSLFSGEFMKGFEAYVVDQFPGRDNFRSIKAVFSNYFFNKKDNNGLYVADGHISKIEYPVNPEMVSNAESKFNFLYDKYMKDKNVNIYLSLIPDKNYFLARKNGYPSINYGKFINDFKGRMDYMKYIDILPLLSIDEFYSTDSHWKQECIKDVAEHIGMAMGTDVSSVYTENTLDVPFKGVYLGQSAVPFKPDTIKYLTNDVLSACEVNYFDTGMAVKGDIYNMEKAHGKDPYEMFLSGTSALIEIKNPNAKTEKELVVFRDSYGSSLVPLLIPGYSKITVVDIRYIQSAFVGSFVKFDNQDVLFLYSTTLINNSGAMR